MGYTMCSKHMSLYYSVVGYITMTAENAITEYRLVRFCIPRADRQWAKQASEFQRSISWKIEKSLDGSYDVYNFYLNSLILRGAVLKTKFFFLT